jgi:PAS domain S-box-containing protein
MGPERLRPVEQSSDMSFLFDQVGCLINGFPKPAVLADALVPDCPIIGASDPFVELCGYSRKEILGQNCRFLLKDVPGYRISRSGRRNLRSMIRMCRLVGLSNMGNTSCCQENCTRDGETFRNCFAVGLVLLGEHPFLVSIQSVLPETGKKAEAAQTTQENHAMIEQIRIYLEQKVSEEAKCQIMQRGNCLLPRRRVVSNAEAFYSGTLTDRVILANDRRTVMRREPWEIPRGCVVISEEPLRRTGQGLFFAIRLEGVLKEGWNSSWPMLGMTQMSPADVEKYGYPMKAEWCGKSICIGGEFQAWVRDKPDHLNQLFGKPREDDITSFDGPRPRWQNRSTTPWELNEGDVMGMLYTEEGIVHLMMNYQTVLSIDTGRPMRDGDYYALVDCQGQAYEITRLAFDTPIAACSNELGLQPKISYKVFDYVAKAAASQALSSCEFSVTIADPSQPDIPLVAVSPGFEKMTGFSCEEIVGKNCRFLNYDCDMDLEQRMRIRETCRTGAPSTHMLENRRKNGEAFVNLLDLRGLQVAKDCETHEQIWYLIGIQSDITELVDLDKYDGEAAAAVEESHKRDLSKLVGHIRKEFTKEFARFAVASRMEPVNGNCKDSETSETSSTTVGGLAEDILTTTPTSSIDEIRDCHFPAESNPIVENQKASGLPSVMEEFKGWHAAAGIQAGPKPNMQANIILLSEPSWCACAAVGSSSD